jgi:hypothetical protein
VSQVQNLRIAMKLQLYPLAILAKYAKLIPLNAEVPPSPRRLTFNYPNIRDLTRSNGGGEHTPDLVH